MLKNPTNYVPLESLQSSFEEKTPVANIVSLHMTPLYGL
jgi:hypothetical protein